MSGLEGRSLLSSNPLDYSEHDSSYSSNNSENIQENEKNNKRVQLIKSVVRNSIETIKQTIKPELNNGRELNLELGSRSQIGINSQINSETTTTTTTPLKKVSYCSPENILLWKNLGKWTDSTKTLRLLQNVSGRVKAGEIVAVMGHSGCGKVTIYYYYYSIKVFILIIYF